MLYIFDLGNVIIDIDFKRVLSVWSNFSGIPLATVNERFVMGDAFEKHERGEISDQAFAQAINDEMMMSLSFEQFSIGWQAIFIDVRQEVLDVIKNLKAQGHRVVILSNTNHLHTTYWPEKFPEVSAYVDKVYLSQQMGMRKPETRIYHALLDQECMGAEQTVFFDDNADNIAGAITAGITAIHVTDRTVIPAYFA